MKRKATAARVLAGLAALALAFEGAHAAELPTMKPKHAEKAKTCVIDGMAGVLVPGSAMCVKVGGYISAGVAVGK
jgi:hypothetical protein